MRGKAPDGYDQTYAAATEAFADVYPDVPKTADAFKKAFKKGDKTWTWNYARLAFTKFLNKAHKDFLKRRNDLVDYGSGWCAWFGLGSFVGANMSTPVSDGEYIYVVAGYNDVYCYSVDDERKWCRWLGPAPDHHGRVLGSPIQVGDKLITYTGFKGSPSILQALDKASGETLWEQKPPGGMSYHMITPVALDLPLPDGSDLTIIWTGNGNVVRADDGKILAKRVGSHGNGRHIA